MPQETLGKGDEVISALSKMMHGWVFHALDATRRSRGVVSGFNSKKIREVSSWGSENYLALELFSN